MASRPEEPRRTSPAHLRLARIADAPAIHAIYAPIVRETAISFEWDPPDVEEIADRMARTVERLPWLVAVGAADALATDKVRDTRTAHPVVDPRSTASALEVHVAADETVLGYAYATPYRTRVAYRWSTEVSVYVAQAAQRRGVGRRLYNALFALLRAQNYHIAYAGITVPNAASVTLHEALGFERIGVFPDAGFKLGAWHDVLWMHRELAPAVSDPREPLPLSHVDAMTIRNALR
ncbi:MAG: GNAT family N-acetyltransferase [Longimicrobiales bacterium]